MAKKRVAVYIYTNDRDAERINAKEEHYRTRIAEDENKELVQFYFDCCCGLHGERRELEHLLHDAELGKFDIVLTRSMDKLSRNGKRLLEIYERLKKAGVELETEKDGKYGGNTELMLTMLANVPTYDGPQYDVDSAADLLKYLEEDIDNSAADDDVRWELTVGDFHIEVPLNKSLDILRETVKRITEIKEDED